MKKLLFIALSMFLFISFCFNTGIYAGTTGKIQGAILDSESNDPLPGVNIILEGTTYGAATDENGFFFIINVPPGTYRLKATMVGYAVETKEDVRVFVDRTTSVNFNLQTQSVAGEEVTITAERMTVPLDVSSTEAYINGLDIVESPAGRFDELIGYQAGVEFSNETYQQEERGFSIRGGEVFETDVQVDGVSLMNKQYQGVNMPISRNLIQDVQVLTGGFNAEYGNLRSGLINVVTKDGSYNRYSGILETRYSPKDYKHWGINPYDQDTENGNEYAILHWGETAYTGVTKAETYHYRQRPNNNWNYFRPWKGFNKWAESRKYGPQFYYDLSRWYHRPLPMMTSGDVMLDAVAGGPVPFMSNTKFFISGYWNRAEYPTNASRARSNEYNTSIKITKRIKSNMVLTVGAFSTFTYGISTAPGYAGEYGNDYSGNARKFGGRMFTNPLMMLGDDKYLFASRSWRSYYVMFDPAKSNPQDDRTNTISLKFTHTVSPKTYYELAASAYIFDSDRHHMRSTDPTPIKFITDIETGETEGFTEAPLGWSGIMDYSPTGSRWTTLGMYTRPGARLLLDNVMKDFQIKGTVVSQVDKYNQIKAGFQLSRAYLRTDMELYSVNSYKDVTNPLTRPFFFNKFKVRPWQFEWYIQDKLEWEGMILNFGFRSLTYFPGVNGFDLSRDSMFGYDDEGKPLWNWKYQFGNVVDGGNWNYAEARTRKVKAKFLIQPRIGISHPLTESSKIYFNYGHFYNQPVTPFLFNSFVRSWRTWSVLGVPDLKWPKVISYEIGYSQSIYDQLLLQISGYYKDYSDEVAQYEFLSYYGDNQGASFANLGYKDIRGLEFRIERSFGSFINGWANYNYMISSWGITGFANIYQDPVKANEQLFDQTQERPEILPTFRANLSLRTPVGWGPFSPIFGIKPLSEWKINLLYSWADGGKMLWSDPSTDPAREWKYVERVNIRISDLYVSKTLARSLQLYCQIKNVFNNKRLRLTGGNYRDSLRLWFEEGEEKGNDKIGDYKGDHIYTGPHKWSTFLPDRRDWYFGIRYQF